MLFITITTVNGQSYIGFLSDNYSGVNSVIANPANIVDSRFKTDINLIGASIFAGNDYYGINMFDAIKDDYDFDIEPETSPSTDNNLGFNMDVMGPSFMFNLNEKSSIAIFTRARTFINIDEVNGETPDLIDDAEISDDFVVDEGDFDVTAQAWAELGITYARVFLNNDEHFFKGGLTLKYLKGAGSAYINGKDLLVDYDEDGTDLGGGQTTGSLTATGDATYARFGNFDDENYEYELPDASGFGTDIGFVYEWRPKYMDYTKNNTKGDSYTFKDKNKYKLKLGISITDLGSVKYNDGVEDTYSLQTPDISEEDIEDAESLDEFLSEFYTLTSNITGYKTKLPTALHLNADWSFNDRLYLNLNTDLSLVSKGKVGASRISNVVSLTPRFESKWFSFYLPLSVIENNGFQVGSGLRLGPLYMGSGSILSVLTSDNSKGADAYAGLKIPVYQGKPKDKDGDGVLDKLDACPKVPGAVENNGCPWEDKDDDGLLDNVDQCPEESGPERNNGCPWGDKDGDTVKDNVDKCPTIPGVVENFGCPWLDGDNDGVFDKDDKCPEVAGTVANNGCPEVVEPTEEVQKTLNNYAKTILFNSGKSSIKEESNQVLNEIVKILQEYPKAKFTVEGHTDSVGSELLNKRLSDSRANAVKKFLVDNGVDPFRLSAIGYGEVQPIATNTTSSGRAQNRRVEINLVK